MTYDREDEARIKALEEFLPDLARLHADQEFRDRYLRERSSKRRSWGVWLAALAAGATILYSLSEIASLLLRL